MITSIVKQNLVNHRRC